MKKFFILDNYTHGFDHLFTGLHTAYTGHPRPTASSHLLQKTGLSPQSVNFIDNGLSLAGSMGGSAVMQSSRAASYSMFSLSKPTYSVTGNAYSSTIFDRYRGSFPFGSRRSPFEYSKFQLTRNKATVIHNRIYTGHALDRMQDRGLMPLVVENAITSGKIFPTKIPGRFEYHDQINNLRVIVQDGRVISVIPKRNN